MNSEPKLLVLGGNRGSWSAHERPDEASTMNGIEAWVYAFGGDYAEGPTATAKDLEGYDIIIANTNHPFDHLLDLAEGRPKGTKWVTLIEGNALDYLKPQPYIRALMGASDLVGCINQYSEEFFRRCTSTKVAFVGIPYPARGIRELATPKPERRREIFLAPMMLSQWLEFFCVQDLGIPVFGYERRLTRNRRTVIKTWRKHRSLDPWYFHNKTRSLYQKPELSIYRDEPLPNFFRRCGGALLWLNMDQRYTWGRYVLDAAALQVPIVTTKSTGHGEHFFPLTTIEHEFEIDKAAALVKQLLTDQDFYDAVANVPIEKFDHLRPEVKKHELMQILYTT